MFYAQMNCVEVQSSVEGLLPLGGGLACLLHPRGDELCASSVGIRNPQWTHVTLQLFDQQGDEGAHAIAEAIFDSKLLQATAIIDIRVVVGAVGPV